MWLGKGESTKSSLLYPFWSLRQEWVPEAPSIILHWYLRDKTFFTWPLLTTRDPRKLVILFSGFCERRWQKMRLGLEHKENHPTFSASVNCTVFVLPHVYLPCCLFSKLVSSSKKFICFIFLLNNEITLCYEFSYEDSFDNIPWVLMYCILTAIF